MSKRKTIKEFVEGAKNIHNNKYDYSKVNYKNSHTKICIICPEHGEFWQTPQHHLEGHGCIKCGIKPVKGKLTKTTEQFIKEARKIHGDKYDYSKVEYVNAFTKVCIICPKHGDHLRGSGCKYCKTSKGKNIIRNWLIKNNIKFIHDRECLKWLINENGNRLRPDFYLSDYNLIIEYDGEQHFQVFKDWGGEQRYEHTKYLDGLKNKLCEENGVSILRIPYTEFDNIEDILNKTFKVN